MLTAVIEKEIKNDQISYKTGWVDFIKTQRAKECNKHLTWIELCVTYKKDYLEFVTA